MKEVIPYEETRIYIDDSVYSESVCWLDVGPGADKMKARHSQIQGRQRIFR